MSSWIDPLVEVLIFSLVETLILQPQIPIPRLPRIASSGAAIVLVSRRLGVCQAFVGRAALSYSQLYTRSVKQKSVPIPQLDLYGCRQFSKSARSMSDSKDEVQAAKEAAAAYESSDKDGAGPPTVFDKILSGEWDSKMVHDDDKCYAFHDISPQAPTHILVIPKVRDSLVKLSDAREDQSALLGHMIYIAGQIGKKECPKGFRIVVNDGEEGAQSVYHLHIHILGGRQMTWPPG